MSLRKCVLIGISFIFITVYGCTLFHTQDIESTSLENRLIFNASRVVVLGFKPALKSGQNPAAVPKDRSGIVSGSEPVSESAAHELSEMLFAILKNKKQCEFIGPAETRHLVDGSAYDRLEESEIDVIKAIGSSFSADGVIIGYLYRWRDRVGTEFSVEKPASVSFDLYLIESKSGAQLWKGRYDKKQSSLSQDLLKIKDFFKNKGKWISADKLAEIGLNELIENLPLEGK